MDSVASEVMALRFLYFGTFDAHRQYHLDRDV